MFSVNGAYLCYFVLQPYKPISISLKSLLNFLNRCLIFIWWFQIYTSKETAFTKQTSHCWRKHRLTLFNTWTDINSIYQYSQKYIFKLFWWCFDKRMWINIKTTLQRKQYNLQDKFPWQVGLFLICFQLDNKFQMYEVLEKCTYCRSDNVDQWTFKMSFTGLPLLTGCEIQGLFQNFQGLFWANPRTFCTK